MTAEIPEVLAHVSLIILLGSIDPSSTYVNLLSLQLQLSPFIIQYLNGGMIVP